MTTLSPHYERIFEALNNTKGQLSYEGRGGGTGHREVSSLLWSITESIKPAQSAFENLTNFRLIHEGAIEATTLRKCTLYADLTAYICGKVSYWDDYDDMLTNFELSISSEYVEALELLKPLLVKGQSILLPSEYSFYEQGMWPGTCTPEITRAELDKRIVRVYSGFFDADLEQVRNEAQRHSLVLPLPSLAGLDIATLADLREEFSREFETFRNDLIKLLKSSPSEIESQPVKNAIESVADSLITLSEAQHHHAKGLQSAGLQIHLKFCLAVITSVAPFPFGLLSLIYDLPTVQDLISWYKKRMRKEDWVTPEMNSLKFPWTEHKESKRH